jgi:hypothetical protein
MTKLQSYPYVKAALWYNFRNHYWLRDEPSSWEANAGMIRTDFTPKPVYGALKAWTGAVATPVTTMPSVDCTGRMSWFNRACWPYGTITG